MKSFVSMIRQNMTALRNLFSSGRTIAGEIPREREQPGKVFTGGSGKVLSQEPVFLTQNEKTLRDLDMPEDLLDVDDILKLYEDLIGKIRDILPLTDKEFSVCLMPLIRNFISFAYTLPASEYYHHHDFLGLVTHSLETAFFASRALFDECIDFHLPGGERTARESRVAGCVFASAMLHDVGKPLADLRVYTDRRCRLKHENEQEVPGTPSLLSADKGNGETCTACHDRWKGEWNPLDTGLYDFLRKHHCGGYLFEYVPLRGKRHEQLAMIAAGAVIPQTFLSWMLKAPDLLEHTYACISGDRNSLFYDLVKRADILSVKYYLTEIRLGGVKAGIMSDSGDGPVPLNEEIMICNRKSGAPSVSETSGENDDSLKIKRRFNVFRSINDNTSGVVELAVELLQQRIANSSNPCNAPDSCLFFTDRECLLCVNTFNFFSMMAPLKNTGMAAVIKDSMDLYEKLILTGIGEYAGGSSSIILHRILVSFDGRELTELRGLKIVRPEFLFGGLKPAPLTSYSGDMLKAYDSLCGRLADSSGLSETVSDVNDNSGSGRPITVSQCLDAAESLKDKASSCYIKNRTDTPESDPVCKSAAADSSEMKETRQADGETLEQTSNMNSLQPVPDNSGADHNSQETEPVKNISPDAFSSGSESDCGISAASGNVRDDLTKGIFSEVSVPLRPQYRLSSMMNEAAQVTEYAGTDSPASQSLSDMLSESMVLSERSYRKTGGGKKSVMQSVKHGVNPCNIRTNGNGTLSVSAIRQAGADRSFKEEGITETCSLSDSYAGSVCDSGNRKIQLSGMLFGGDSPVSRKVTDKKQMTIEMFARIHRNTGNQSESGKGILPQSNDERMNQALNSHIFSSDGYFEETGNPSISDHDWLNNPMRIRPEISRPRDAHGRFVKMTGDKKKLPGRDGHGDSSSVKNSASGRDPAHADNRMSGKTCDISHTSDLSVTTDRDMLNLKEIESMLEKTVSLSDDVLYRSFKAFTFKQINSLASKIKFRITSRGRSIRLLTQIRTDTVDMSRLSRDYRKFCSRISPVFFRVCQDFNDMTMDRSEFAFVEPAVGDVIKYPQAKVAGALQKLTPVQMKDMLRLLLVKSVPLR